MARSPSNAALPRRGFAARGLIVAAVVLSAAAALALAFWPQLSFSAKEAPPMLHTVERGEFIHEITDRGNVESAENVEVRCEVEAKGGGGCTILEIVPEGTTVRPGDVLVKLDSSGFETQLTNQQIICNNSRASVIQAQSIYDTAVKAKEEYEQGQYVLDYQAIQNKIIVAEENLRRAEDYLKYSKRLAAKGYVTKLQLQADEFAVEKAKNELDSAKKELDVLENFSKVKKLIQLNADVRTAEARLEAQKDSFRLDQEELDRIKEQIEKCVIRSPDAGQVVYANQSGYRGSREVLIEAGEMVRERQAIIKLPNPEKMQVEAKINEAKIGLVEVGMPATIQLDAFSELQLQGTVEKVNEFPVPTSWFSSSVKEYETTIRIDKSAPNLRPGLTAQVKILVEHIENALQVPAQTIFEHGAKFYYVTYDDGEFQAHVVQIGSTNDKFVVIESGLAEGQQIVLNAAAYRDVVDLPELQPNNGAAAARARAASASPSSPARAGGDRKQPPGRSGPGGSGDKPPGRGGGLAAMFSNLDKDGNGRLEGDEIPEMMRQRVSSIDTNGDGAIQRSEMQAAVNRFRQQGGGGPSGPGGPRPGAGAGPGRPRPGGGS